MPTASTASAPPVRKRTKCVCTHARPGQRHARNLREKGISISNFGPVQVPRCRFSAPTHDEMVELTETERLFKSSLFRLEMDEMLKEVHPPDVSAARFAERKCARCHSVSCFANKRLRTSTHDLPFSADERLPHSRPPRRALLHAQGSRVRA